MDRMRIWRILTVLGVAWLSAAVTFGDAENRQPPDLLTGPPHLIASAWGVYNGHTWELIGGEGVDCARAIASMTKLMTLRLALREIEQDASVLDSVVHISESAGKQSGSSAQLNPGESIRLRDLLYAMMLPSGNDAAVALAEHFGGYDSFVQRMNEEAATLNMQNTRYMNPHGLDQRGHESSIADLALLTRSLDDDPMFWEIVMTRSHTAIVTTAEGEERETTWNNTNQLLDIEGYYGVKTGTTGRAGACLVSMGERDDHRLVVIVIGSSRGAGRYVDSRNLYRWGWRELGL